MKNNKGFTLVELIASFSLALIIMFFLFQIVITVKEIYISSGIKTELLIRQANMEKMIETDLREKVLTSLTSCGTDCYTFYYSDSSSKVMRVDHTQNTISYGDYTISMLDGSSIGAFTIAQNTVAGVSIGKSNTIVKIDIPVTNKVVTSRDVGIHLVYQYDNRVTDLGL